MKTRWNYEAHCTIELDESYARSLLGGIDRVLELLEGKGPPRQMHDGLSIKHVYRLQEALRQGLDAKPKDTP